MTRTSTKKGGFSLIEAIVSVTLLVIAIAGPMTIASRSLSATRNTQKELVATRLAEEAMETLHNMRDNNSADDASLDRSGWMSNSTSIFSTCRVHGCILDTTDTTTGGGTGALHSCSGASCGAAESVVYLNPTTNIYHQTGGALGAPWVDSGYKRWITMSGVDHPVNPQLQVLVTVTVTFPGYDGGLRTLTFHDSLYNWFPYLH